MRPLSRRAFLRLSALASGGVVVSTGLSGCSSSDDDDGAGAGGENGGSDVPGSLRARFDHGVASGDPGTDRAILWTRATPVRDGADDDASGAGTVTVRWEVATDPEFANLVNDGETEAVAERDWTVRIDARNLAAGTTHHYRFVAGDVVSPSGRFRTLPAGPVPEVALAVVSCSNYPAGFFHVYRELAALEDLDAVLHLGDYIYEYEAGVYPDAETLVAERALPADADEETLTLEQYRARYALYRTDPDLQAAHASAAFITVWDDHEVANDAWRNGAENHDPVTEGDYEARREAALRAWFEWTPVRPASEGDEQTIYRRFEFGELATLHMLDTRHAGRDPQLSIADYVDPTSGTLNGTELAAALADPNRTLLGAEQLGWLQQGLSASPAIWQVLGQQVLMGRMLVPAELVASLPAAPDPATFAELVGIKARLLQGDPSLTDAERARVETVIPYNLDAWDGYAAEREAVLETARRSGANLVTLAGDTHNAWANDLATLDGTAVGVELATPSVTSPGLETILGVDGPEAAAATEGALVTLIDGLRYLNVADRGWMVVRLTPERASAQWHYVDTVKTAAYERLEDRARELSSAPGETGRTLGA